MRYKLMRDKFLSDYHQKLACYISVTEGDSYIGKWLDDETRNYKENRNSFGLEVPCNITSILDNILMDME